MPFVCMEGLRNGGTATCESSQVHIYRLGSECSGRPGSGRSGGWAGRQLMKKQEWSHILLPAKGAAAQGASVPWLPAAGCSQGTSVPLGSSGRCGSGYWSGAGLRLQRVQWLLQGAAGETGNAAVAPVDSQ